MADFSKSFHFPSFLPRRGPTTPVSPRRHGFGLFRVRSPLLTESLFIFSSYGYLDVSVPHVRPRVRVCRGRASTGCPIRISPDLGVFATPRSFSQLITSFFAFESLGILHMPFFAFFYLFALRVFTLMSCLLVLFRLLPIRQ